MTDFLRIPLNEQTDILNAMAVETGTSAQILLKDIWVCWALKQLFQKTSSIRMAFKGGTSLSKAFNAISRFSEDVDITLDHRDLCRHSGLKTFSENMSRTKIKSLSEQLQDQARAFIRTELLPLIEISFARVTRGTGKVEIDLENEKLKLHYPTAFHSVGNYMGDWIMLEFGGRNVTTPCTAKTITTKVAPFLPELVFPEATVSVLSPERTFWEKATLIHVACQRPEKYNAARISRHWYDLFMLYRVDIGKKALSNRTLLEEVVHLKKAFFHTSYANYDACLENNFCLVPREPLLSQLKQDYIAMNISGMFESPPPDFEEMMTSIADIEKKTNR